MMWLGEGLPAPAAQSLPQGRGPPPPHSIWAGEVKPEGQKNAQRGVAGIWTPLPQPVSYYTRHPFPKKIVVKYI